MWLIMQLIKIVWLNRARIPIFRIENLINFLKYFDAIWKELIKYDDKLRIWVKGKKLKCEQSEQKFI